MAARAPRATGTCPAAARLSAGRSVGPRHASRRSCSRSLGCATPTDLAERLPWRRLLLASYVVGLAWLLALALVDGPERHLAGAGQPVRVPARPPATVDDVPALLREYVARIPYDAPETTGRSTSPATRPATLLFFVLLVRVGLGGDLAAGLVVIVLAATIAAAVLVTLRALGAEARPGGRRRSWC